MRFSAQFRCPRDLVVHGSDHRRVSAWAASPGSVTPLSSAARRLDNTWQGWMTALDRAHNTRAGIEAGRSKKFKRASRASPGIRASGVQDGLGIASAPSSHTSGSQSASRPRHSSTATHCLKPGTRVGIDRSFWRVSRGGGVAGWPRHRLGCLGDAGTRGVERRASPPLPLVVAQSKRSKPRLGHPTIRTGHRIRHATQHDPRLDVETI